MTELWGVQQEQARTGLNFAHEVLLAGLNGSERYSLADIEDGVIAGDLQLWIAWKDHSIVKAVGVTELFDTKTTKVACIVYGTGDLDVLMSHIGTIEAWAEAMGRTVEIFGRPGWDRKLPAYQIKHVLLEKKHELIEA